MLTLTTPRVIIYSMLALGLNLGLGLEASADTTISITAKPHNINVFVKDQTVRLQSSSPQNNQIELIFDVVSQTLNVIDHTTRTQRPVTKATISQFESTIGTTAAAISNQLKGIPKKQRSQLEQLMGDFGFNVKHGNNNKPPLKLTKTKTSNVIGIPCVETQVHEGETHLNTLCINENQSLPMPSQDYQSLLSAQRFLISAASKLAPLASHLGYNAPNLDKISPSGIVVRSLEHFAYKPGNGLEVYSGFSFNRITTYGLAPISIPAGYKIVSTFN